MKIVTSKSRLQRRAMEQIEHLCPIVTVAEGRSRREMKRVDYNFRSYDEQLQVYIELLGYFFITDCIIFL